MSAKLSLIFIFLLNGLIFESHSATRDLGIENPLQQATRLQNRPPQQEVMETEKTQEELTSNIRRDDCPHVCNICFATFCACPISATHHFLDCYGKRDSRIFCRAVCCCLEPWYEGISWLVKGPIWCCFCPCTDEYDREMLNHAVHCRIELSNPSTERCFPHGRPY